MSTANSQLLLIGSMMSYDVVAQYGKWKKTEDHILGLTQLFIFLGGTLALLLSLNPPSNSLFFGADIWGLFSAILTPLLYGTLYYKRATRTGAWAAFVTGVAGTVLLQPRELPVYWGFPVTLCSTLVLSLSRCWRYMEKTCLLKAGIWKHEGGRQQREGGENER